MTQAGKIKIYPSYILYLNELTILIRNISKSYKNYSFLKVFNLHGYQKSGMVDLFIIKDFLI